MNTHTLPRSQRARNRALPPANTPARHPSLDEARMLARLLGAGLPELAVALLGPRFPHGKWTLTDGREIIFARSYEPLWQRRHGQVSVAPDEWFRIARREYFFDDWPQYYQQHDGCSRLREVLSQWGLE